MATNPRTPEQYTPQQRPGSKITPKAPSSPTPGVILAIVVALLLLGAIFYFLPRTPERTRNEPPASIPSQPVGGELQLGQPAMSVDPTGRSVNLDAKITNRGLTDVTGIMAQVSFTTGTGEVVSVNRPVSGLAGGDQTAGAGGTQDLTSVPIKPGEIRPVRISVDNVPQNWNREMPGIRFTAVTAK